MSINNENYISLIFSKIYFGNEGFHSYYSLWLTPSTRIRNDVVVEEVVDGAVVFSHNHFDWQFVRRNRGTIFSIL